MAYWRMKIIVGHQFGEPEPDWIEEPVNSDDHIWSSDACRSLRSLWLSEGDIPLMNLGHRAARPHGHKFRATERIGQQIAR
jgi:hypothetical protein